MAVTPLPHALTCRSAVEMQRHPKRCHVRPHEVVLARVAGELRGRTREHAHSRGQCLVHVMPACILFATAHATPCPTHHRHFGQRVRPRVPVVRDCLAVACKVLLRRVRHAAVAMLVPSRNKAYRARGEMWCVGAVDTGVRVCAVQYRTLRPRLCDRSRPAAMKTCTLPPLALTRAAATHALSPLHARPHARVVADGLHLVHQQRAQQAVRVAALLYPRLLRGGRAAVARGVGPPWPAGRVADAARGAAQGRRQW